MREMSYCFLNLINTFSLYCFSSAKKINLKNGPSGEGQRKNDDEGTLAD